MKDKDETLLLLAQDKENQDANKANKDSLV